MLSILLFVSQVFAVSTEECIVSANRFHRAHPTVEIAFHFNKSTMVAPIPIVISNGVLDRETSFDLNQTLRLCYRSGLDRAVYQMRKGSTKAYQHCVLMNLDNLSFHCNPSSKEMEIKRMPK